MVTLGNVKLYVKSIDIKEYVVLSLCIGLKKSVALSLSFSIEILILNAQSVVAGRGLKSTFTVILASKVISDLGLFNCLKLKKVSVKIVSRLHVFLN